jgi:glycosyltransferase involved in cell wall biosynthesis
VTELAAPVGASGNKITVVIPTFNRRAQLQKAVESVLQERRVPIAVHIFDNASSDDTQAYVQELLALDARVSYVRRPENIGATGNYQKALGTISTAYFVPLADDDWVLPDFLYEAYEILEADGALGAAVFYTEVRDAQGTLLGTYPSQLDQFHFGPMRSREHMIDWLRYSHYAWSSILWRTKTLACLGEPYLCTGLPSDVDFQAQIFCRYPVHLVNKPGAVFFSHAGQESRGYNISHIASWSELFRRLDNAVHRQGLFSLEEYLPLRAIIERRYRDAWSAALAVDPPATLKISAACEAGFRLGDWDTAFSLLQGVHPLDPSDATAVFKLPPMSRRTPTRPTEGIADDPGALLSRVVVWMRQAVDAIAQLEERTESLTRERDGVRFASNERLAAAALRHDVLALQLAQASTRESAALVYAEKSEQARLELEQRFEKLRRHPLARAARKLGLLRLVR